MPKVKSYTPKESKEILNYVNELKSVTLTQMQKLVNEVPPDIHNYYVKYLYQTFALDIIEGNVLVPAGQRNVDRNMIDCLWVAIDNLARINKSLIFRAQAPASLVYQMENGNIQELVKINSLNANSLLLLQERYYARAINEANDNAMQYVVVIDNEDTLDAIEPLNLKMPHIVALVEKVYTEIPSIIYFTGATQEEDDENGDKFEA